MTPEQEDHLNVIKSAFKFLVDTKYRKGQKEHGGNLFDKTILQLVDNAIDEAIDQVVYLITLRNKLLPPNNSQSSNSSTSS